MITKVRSPQSHTARNEELKKLVELLQYKKDLRPDVPWNMSDSVNS